MNLAIHVGCREAMPGALKLQHDLSLGLMDAGARGVVELVMPGNVTHEGAALIESGAAATLAGRRPLTKTQTAFTGAIAVHCTHVTPGVPDVTTGECAKGDFWLRGGPWSAEVFAATNESPVWQDPDGGDPITLKRPYLDGVKLVDPTFGPGASDDVRTILESVIV